MSTMTILQSMNAPEAAQQSHFITPVAKIEEVEKVNHNISSFTELKTECSHQIDPNQTKKEQQSANHAPVQSREDLISISETLNGQVQSLRSTDTIFTEEDLDKIDHDEIKESQKKSSGSSDKSSIKMSSLDNTQSTQNLGTCGQSLLESTPFQVLQESRHQSCQPNNPTQKTTDRLFTPAHTQEITIQHSTSKEPFQDSAEKAESKSALLESSFAETEGTKDNQNLRTSKFKILRTIEQSHVPKIEQANQEQKAQPLKIESLYVNSLRTNSDIIKPPEPYGEKKPKIWQMFKSKRENKQALPGINSTPTPKQTETTSITEQKKEESKRLQDLVNETIKLDSKDIQCQVGSEKQQASGQTKAQPKTINFLKQQKTESKIMENDLADSKQLHESVEFHRSQHHPLEPTKQDPLQADLKPLKLEMEPDKQPSQQVSKIDQNQQVSKIGQNQQAKQDEQSKLPNRFVYQQQTKLEPVSKEKQQQQSEASSSSKQQIAINYHHNKKYQEQLQIRNRKRIKELEQKLKNQEEINRQLSKSMSLPIKLLGSVVMGAATAGISWVAKRNKNLSMIVGVATTFATLVFSY